MASAISGLDVSLDANAYPLHGIFIVMEFISSGSMPKAVRTSRPDVV